MANLTNFEKYSFTVVGGMPLLWPWATMNPIVMRVMIRRAPSDLLKRQQVQSIARALASALARQFEDYDVLGITITQPARGIQLGNALTDETTFVADTIFKLNSPNLTKPIGVTAANMEEAIRNKLTENRINATIVTLLDWGSYSNSDDAERQALFSFWANRNPLFEWNGKEAQTTATFDAGLHKQGFGADDRSFCLGLSDQIRELAPFPRGMWDSGTLPLPPQPTPPPVPDESKPPQPALLGGFTVGHVAIAAVFALVGWQAYHLFRGRK